MGGLSGTLRPSASPSAVGSSTCHRTGMVPECGAAPSGTAWLLLSDTSHFAKTVPGLASGAQSTEPDTLFPGELVTSLCIRLTFLPRVPESCTPGAERQGRSQPGPEGSARAVCRGEGTPHDNYRKLKARATLLSCSTEDGARYRGAKRLPDCNSGCSFSNCGQCNLGLPWVRGL